MIETPCNFFSYLVQSYHLIFLTYNLYDKSLLFSHQKSECSKIWKPSSDPESVESEAPKISQKKPVKDTKCTNVAEKPKIIKSRIKVKQESKSDSRIDSKSISSKESVSRRYKVS